MTDLWQRLQQRKMVQWAIAYTAAAFALLQGVDIVADRFAWPGMITRVLIIASFVGFFITLVLAWYHGERGEQKVKGTIAGVIAISVAHSGRGLPVTTLVGIVMATLVVWIFMMVLARQSPKESEPGIMHAISQSLMGLIVMAMGLQIALKGAGAYFHLALN